MKIIDKETKLFALLDDMASNSTIPKEFNELFTSSNLNCSYIPLNIRDDDILFTVKGLKTSQINGVNIGKIYQSEVLPLIDILSEEAKESQFITSIKIQNGKLYGYITIGEAISSLLSGKVAIFGANNLSKSILWHIDDISHITLLESEIEKTSSILEKYPDLDVKFFNENRPFDVEGFNYIIDTTENGDIYISYQNKLPKAIWFNDISPLAKLGDISILEKIREIEHKIDIREWLSD